MRRVVWAAVALVVVAAGCTSSDPSAVDRSSTTRPEAEPAGTAACDDVDPSACLLPWPNDRLTRADPTTATGRRLDLPADGMPKTAKGVPIDPTEWNRNDGFSPASTLLAHIDDLDVDRSGLPPVTAITETAGDHGPIVLLDTTAHRVVPLWTELDANASDPSEQALMIVPATALIEGHHHVVGLRNLKRTDGTDVVPSKGFAARMAKPDLEARQAFAALRRVGFATRDLDLAWDFTVGSADSISGRLRHMWDETSAQVGDGAPPFEVTSMTEEGAARIVRGRFEVPNYLTGDGGPGSTMRNDRDPDGIPTRHGTIPVDFLCLVPTAATASEPAASVLYGHGLLGSREEVLGIGSLGASVNLSFCAIDYLGMSANDVGSVVASFDDLSDFRALPDRLQEGHLAFLLLGRLLASDQGFVTDPAFQDADGKPVLDTSSVSLLGASQGGILGGVASSLATDWKQVILAVPGMGYNLLLRRSVDFDEFFPAVEASYPGELDQTVILDLLEQLWQRGENAGYAQHLVHDPYPGVTAKHVLLLEAFGDHQVANVSTEKLARTLRIGRRAPTLADGRSTDLFPFRGIEPIELPSNGSGLVMWDFGTPAPPTTNLPNRAGEDPHGKLSDVPEALALVLAFVHDGQITEVCGGSPCQSPG